MPDLRYTCETVSWLCQNLSLCCLLWQLTECWHTASLQQVVFHFNTLVFSCKRYSMALLFNFISSSAFQVVLCQKGIWVLFWCQVDPAAVWTEVPAVLHGSGRFRWTRACTEPKWRHMFGVSSMQGCSAPFCKMSCVSFHFAFLNFIGVGMDLASFSLSCFFLWPELLGKKFAFPSIRS